MPHAARSCFNRSRPRSNALAKDIGNNDSNHVSGVRRAVVQAGSLFQRLSGWRLWTVFSPASFWQSENHRLQHGLLLKGMVSLGLPADRAVAAASRAPPALLILSITCSLKSPGNARPVVAKPVGGQKAACRPPCRPHAWASGRSTCAMVRCISTIPCWPCSAWPMPARGAGSSRLDRPPASRRPGQFRCRLCRQPGAGQPDVRLRVSCRWPAWRLVWLKTTMASSSSAMRRAEDLALPSASR